MNWFVNTCKNITVCDSQDEGKKDKKKMKKSGLGLNPSALKVPYKGPFFSGFTFSHGKLFFVRILYRS